MRNDFLKTILLHEVTVTKSSQTILQGVCAFVCIPYSHLSLESCVTAKKENRVVKLQDTDLQTGIAPIFSNSFQH